MAIVVVQAKSTQNFPRLFLSPTLPMQKNWVRMVPKQVFTAPPLNSMSIPEASTCRANWINQFINSLVTDTHTNIGNNPLFLGLNRINKDGGFKSKIALKAIFLSF